MMAPIFDTISRLNELSDDPHLCPVELMIKAFVCAASAHCNFLLQQRAEAVAWGNQFLQLTRKKGYKFVIFTAKPTIEWVLEVFYCCGHESLLLSLLHSVHMDATRFMVVREARDYYEKLLGKRRNIAPVESEEEEERIQREGGGAGVKKKKQKKKQEKKKKKASKKSKKDKEREKGKKREEHGEQQPERKKKRGSRAKRSREASENDDG
ncbi:Splicing factor [Balamuthia mandrillaris]